MVTLKEIMNAASNLNAEVKVNIGGKDIELQEIVMDCVDGKIYLYDRILEDITCPLNLQRNEGRP